MKINPVTAIVILVIILIVAGFSALMVSPGQYDNCRLKTFITVFAGLSLLLTVMFYYAVIQLQVTQGELLELKETQNVQLGIQSVTESVTKAVGVTPQFCAQLMPLQYKNAFSKEGEAKNKLLRVATENEISSRIFNAWQTAVLEYKFVREQEDFYTCLFLQWATSSILRKYWKGAKISLTTQTQQFGDLLFAYAPTENIHCPVSYETACQRLKMDAQYACLF